jgi:hypothetical protein
MKDFLYTCYVGLIRLVVVLFIFIMFTGLVVCAGELLRIALLAIYNAGLLEYVLFAGLGAILVAIIYNIGKAHLEKKFCGDR